MSQTNRLIVILGPTAVGKTELSIQLAKRLGTEIISGDSMLVYRGFDIGTAKPSIAERQGIPHHLIDILDANERFNAVDFKKMAESLIETIQSHGRIPILAGGTSLYIKALLEGYDFCETAEHSDYRQQLEHIAQTQGKDVLYELLQKKDAEAASRIHPNNVRRVIRALEVMELGAEHISTKRDFPSGDRLRYRAWVIGLKRNRQELYERINARVLHMFEHGLAQEVQELLDQGISRDQQAMQGIGYKETVAWLMGEMTREQAVEQIQKSTRHFAKRQMTWYRQMPYIHWYDLDSIAENQLLDVVFSDIEEHLGRG